MCRIEANLGNSSYIYDSTINSVSNILGYIYKDSYGYFNSISNARPEKCMKRPTQSIITIKIFDDTTTSLLVNTPYILPFKGGMTGTVLNINPTVSPLVELENNSFITEFEITAGTSVATRTGQYAYTTNNSVNVGFEPMLMSSSTIPTDMASWTMVINFTPVKDA